MKIRTIYSILFGFIMSYLFNYRSLAFDTTVLVNNPFFVIPFFWIIYGSIIYFLIPIISIFNYNKKFSKSMLFTVHFGSLYILILGIVTILSYKTLDFNQVNSFNTKLLIMLYLILIILNYFLEIHYNRKIKKFITLLSYFIYYSVSFLLTGIFYFLFFILSFLAYWG